MTFRGKTRFVIGAGASNEFGLPVGSQLAALIKAATCTLQRRAYDPTFADEDTIHPVLRAFDKAERGLEFGAKASDLFAIHNLNLSSFKRMRMNLETRAFTSPTYE
jgi:hypothetical protein